MIFFIYKYYKFKVQYNTDIIPGQVPGQVFIKKGLKEVNYENYKSISILYPIDYQ